MNSERRRECAGATVNYVQTVRATPVSMAEGTHGMREHRYTVSKKSGDEWPSPTSEDGGQHAQVTG
jgi:hypothetical protein